MGIKFTLPYEADEIWSAVFGAGAEEYFPWYAKLTQFDGGYGEGWDDARNTAIVYVFHEDDYEEVSPYRARVKSVEVTFEDIVGAVDTLLADPLSNGVRYLDFDNYDADMADVVLQTIVYGKYTFG